MNGNGPLACRCSTLTSRDPPQRREQVQARVRAGRLICLPTMRPRPGAGTSVLKELDHLPGRLVPDIRFRPIDLMAVSAATALHPLEWVGSHPQGLSTWNRRRPVGGRGHHRHRPDAELPAPIPARAGADARSACAACSTSRSTPPGREIDDRLPQVHDPRPLRGRVRASITSECHSQPAVHRRPAPIGLRHRRLPE